MAICILGINDVFIIILRDSITWNLNKSRHRCHGYLYWAVSVGADVQTRVCISFLN